MFKYKAFGSHRPSIYYEVCSGRSRLVPLKDCPHEEEKEMWLWSRFPHLEIDSDSDSSSDSDGGVPLNIGDKETLSGESV